MAKLPRHLALLALLAGTALATTPAIVLAQSSTDAVDQSQSMDQSDDSGNAQELLLKKQNNGNSGEQMPDAEPQDQAVTDEAQDPTAEHQDRATEEELLKQKNQAEDQAQSLSDDADNDQTADHERRKDKNAAEDTATDTSSKKKTDETAIDTETKVDRKSERAASEKPSNETTGSINISTEQKTVIKNTIVETNVKPVDVGFKVSIGINVPRTIELHRLPSKVVEIVPAYREYLYFIVADGTIVIVDPGSYEVVYIISV